MAENQGNPNHDELGRFTSKGNENSGAKEQKVDPQKVLGQMGFSKEDLAAIKQEEQAEQASKAGESNKQKSNNVLDFWREKAQEVSNIPDNELDDEYLDKNFNKAVENSTGEYYIEDIPSPYENYESFETTLDGSVFCDDIVDFLRSDDELYDICETLSEKQFNKFVIDNFDALFERYKDKLAETLGENEYFIDNLIEQQKEEAYGRYENDQYESYREKYM